MEDPEAGGEERGSPSFDGLSKFAATISGNLAEHGRLQVPSEKKSASG